MGLQIKRGITSKYKQLIAAGVAVFALVAQPLVSSNIPSAFALGSTTTVCASGCDAATIQDGINAASAGDTVSVAAGTYVENVNVNKAVTVTGAGAASTKIVATNANATPLTFNTNGATVSGFTITHEYTAGELAAWNFNNNGVLFGQLTSGNTLQNNVISLSRNGVYINRSSNNIIGNTITNNRTGINTTNTIDGTVITGNTISDNWTLGLVYYSSGFATNFNTVTLTGNTFSNNWYSQIGLKDTPASTGTLDVSSNTFTDSPVTYATSSDAAWNEPGFAAQQPVALGGGAVQPTANYYPTLRIYNSGTVVLKHTPKTLRVGTNQPYATLQAANNDAASGDTIELTSDLTTTSQQTLTKSVTINGNGHTLSPTFTKTDNSNNAALGIQSDNVTVNNLIVDGASGTTLHGINVFESDNVVLNNVTTKDNDRSGLCVNGSKVTVSSITTANNGWHGINVDKPGAVLTVNGTSHHTDTLPIYIDNKTVGQLVDTNHQYGSRDNVLQSGDRVYGLKPAAPVLLSPSNNGYTTTNNFYFDWQDVPGAVKYEYQNSKFATTNTSGVLTNINYTANNLTESRLHSTGAADGTVRYWQVRAIDANGIKGDWSTVWKMTIDMTAPAVPVLESPANGALTNINEFWFEWGDVTGASSYEAQFSQSNSTDPTTGSLNVGVWSGDASHNQPTESRAWSAGATGTWYWQVRAVDDAGNKSAWTSPWKLTIDKVKPSTPQITAPTANQEFEGTPGTIRAEWTAATDNSDIAKYQIEYVYTRNGTPTVDYREVAGNRLYRDQSLSGAILSDFTIRVRAQDKAGNWGDWSSAVTYYYGVDAPVAPTDPEEPEEPSVPTDPETPVIPTGPTLPSPSSNTENTDDQDEDSDPQPSTSQQLAQLFIPGSTAVLGTQDSDVDTDENSANTPSDDGEDVLGTTAQPNIASTQAAGFMGLAWYWWLLILAGLVTLWWLVAARRRRASES